MPRNETELGRRAKRDQTYSKRSNNKLQEVDNGLKSIRNTQVLSSLQKYSDNHIRAAPLNTT